MKKVRVTGENTDVTVIITWDNILTEDCPTLKLKKGGDLSIHYRNNKDTLKYEPLVYYDKPYTPNERLEFLKTKNPLVGKLIDAFDLTPTI